MALVRILLADDNVWMLAELRRNLDSIFEIVGAVEDGKHAVDTVLRLDPDIVILDISMPVMNGLQAVE
jgi:CheY-like chemotaxis protein